MAAAPAPGADPGPQGAGTRSVNLPVPPWLVRRFLLAPLMPVLLVLAIVAWPVLTLAQALVAAVLFLTTSRDIRWRLPRVWSFVVVYLCAECLCLGACLVLWPLAATRRGRTSDRSAAAHLAVLRAFLGVLIDVAEFVFRFRLVVDEPLGHPEDEASMAAPAPLVVLARHAGPGASLVLVHLLIDTYRRCPRIVLKEQLRLDPAVDVVLSRLGCGFIRNGPGAGDRAAAQVAAVAGAMSGRDALVLFPEGKDWTPTRHRAAVDLLRRRGRRKEAARAARLDHVLPPRPAGALAALAAAPDADVVIFTHTGHDDMRDLRSVWTRLPLRHDLHMVWWRVPADQLPEGSEATTTWLFDTWERIDAWIDEQTDLSGLTRSHGDAAAVRG